MLVADAAVPPSAELLVQAARDYARAGCEIFPLKPDKSPFTEHGMKEATTDEARIALWWRQWPNALIGCRVPEDIIILDIDTRHGGMATWKALRAAYEPIPPTRAHYSGRNDGGGHLWFKRPSGKLSARPLHQWAKEHGTGHEAGKNSWRAGIDLLANNHRYTILPPSPHPATSKPYRWREGSGLAVEPVEMPKWLAELVTERPTVVAPDLRPIRAPDVDSIADWFSNAYSWADILGPEGWTVVKGDGDSDGSAWRHPNATATLSATIRHHQLFVYSTNTDFEPTEEGSPNGYTPFRAYAVLSHGGDLSAAAREARSWRMPDGNWDLPATLTSGVGTEPRPQPTEVNDFFVDWPTFWTEDHKSEDWLLRPVVATGRQAAVWAVHKTGKSLFSLDVAARVALGRPYSSDEHIDPTDVIYLDMEMTKDDLYERLIDFGYGPETDLTRLHYALLPNLHPLDTAVGAAELCSLVEACSARLVVIDTMSRAVAGEENSADTYRDFFRHTGAALKRLGVALLRLDHAGKDPTKGQRGSSSKGDDVDVVYQLERTDAGYTLHAKATRMGWVPQRSTFRQSNDPFLSFTWAGEAGGWPAGTTELVDALDDLAGRADLTEREAVKLLRANGQGAKTDRVRAALRFRRQRSDELPAVDE